MQNLFKKYLHIKKFDDPTMIPPVLISLLLLYSRPRNISEFMGTLFGKLVMLICIIIGTSHNTMLGLLIAFVFVVLTDNIYEGFDLKSLEGKKKHKGDDDDNGGDDGDDDGDDGDDDGGDDGGDDGDDGGDDNGDDNGNDNDGGGDDGGGDGDSDDGGDGDSDSDDGGGDSGDDSGSNSD